MSVTKLSTWTNSIRNRDWIGEMKSLSIKDLFTKKHLYEIAGFAVIMGSSYITWAWFSREQEGYLEFYLPFLAPGFKIDGFVANGFEKVRDGFIQTYKDKWEQTSQLSVFYKGKEVVNLWGMVDGFKTDDRNYRNLAMMFSSGKTMEGYVIMLLVQRGLLKFDTKIVDVWPEFGKNGKEEITVGEVLNHTAGLAVHPVTLKMEHVSDSNVLSEMIEGMTPKHHGKMFYHGHTRGIIIGEIVRRVDPEHRRINDFIDQEFVQPLKLQYYVGNMQGNMSETEMKNVLKTSDLKIGRLIVKSVLQLILPVSLGGHPPKIMKTLMQMTDPKSDVARMMSDHTYMNDQKALMNKVVNTSNCSFSNAHSMAKLASLCASLVGNGEIDGFKVFTSDIIQESIS